jgi:hypothetical protein
VHRVGVLRLLRKNPPINPLSLLQSPGLMVLQGLVESLL